MAAGNERLLEPSVVHLKVSMQEQPDDVSCGPTCLQAVYSYYGDNVSLDVLTKEIHQLRSGGTLACFLGSHALSRGYRATLFTFDLNTFDPTWLIGDRKNLPAKLTEQMKVKHNTKTSAASRAYLEFLSLGGRLRFEDLNRALIRNILSHNKPVVVGLSSTYLYRCARENPVTNEDDDVGGVPEGHFVVLHGYERRTRLVAVADPYGSKLNYGSTSYFAPIDRVICAILLGIVTYDANLLVIEPRTAGSSRNAKEHS